MNNIVRTAVEALAAVQGGTQSLHTNSYDEAVGLPTAQTARIARNTQLILQEETGVCDVADPWAGSYMMESLTDELEAKARDIVKEVESMGGMTKYIQSGMAKLRIEESATKKQARIDSREDVVVGVNKYRLDKEDEAKEETEVLQIDNEEVREKQISQLKSVKSKRDPDRVAQAIADLEASARLEGSTSSGGHPLNLLRLCISASKARYVIHKATVFRWGSYSTHALPYRCTVGEISSALEAVWGRHVPSSSVVQGAYHATFTSGSRSSGQDEYDGILERVKEFETNHGRRPRILVGKLGQDGHDRGAKVIASGFSDLGFDVDVAPLFQTPEEVVMQALDSDVHVIGISSQAAGHKTLLPALKKELLRRNANHILVVAGGVIPPKDYDFLMKEEVCCSAIFGPGTRVTDAAATVLSLLEEK